MLRFEKEQASTARLSKFFEGQCNDEFNWHRLLHFLRRLCPPPSLLSSSFQLVLHSRRMHLSVTIAMWMISSICKTLTFLLSSRRDAGDVMDDNEKCRSSFCVDFFDLPFSAFADIFHPVKIFPVSFVSSR